MITGTSIVTGATPFRPWLNDTEHGINTGIRKIRQATGSFRLGVWKRVGRSRYSLNHFAISWDQNSNPVGPGNIRENVALARDGQSFSGSFTIDQYDQSGNLLVHIQQNECCAPSHQRSGPRLFCQRHQSKGLWSMTTNPFADLSFRCLGEMPELQIIGEAAAGLEAVQKAEELRPDLILLDVGLPTLNGIEAAGQIRRLVQESK